MTTPKTTAPKAPGTGASRKAASRASGPPAGDALTAEILRFLRRTPNSALDLAPLAAELGVEPFAMQLAAERLAGRRFVTLPFVEPGKAGGAELAQRGLDWLLLREGGVPRDTPAAFQRATERVRAEAEAARLPRAQVYGVRR